MKKIERHMRRLALLAGSLDFCTGLGLVSIPNTVLRLMGAPATNADASVFLRFVGAFVAGVGATYLWAFLTSETVRLRVVFEFTILFRAAAGLYCTWAILMRALPSAWWSVPVTDFTLIALQLLMLRRMAANVASGDRH